MATSLAPSSYFKESKNNCSPHNVSGASLLDTWRRLEESHIVELLQVHLLFKTCHRKQVLLGSKLLSCKVEQFIKFLRTNADIFVWEHSDMIGLDPSIVEHHLNIKLRSRPIQQKMRRFHPWWQEAIRQGVNRLLEAGFIRKIQYLEWLANVIVVPKKNEKWRVSIDYTNLNEAYTKDCFPLSWIDQIVNATTSHELLTFMDVYSG